MSLWPRDLEMKVSFQFHSLFPSPDLFGNKPPSISSSQIHQIYVIYVMERLVIVQTVGYC